MSFRNDFMWGAASAAYQVEGAFDEDGKGLNTWDYYSSLKGKIAHNENGNVACDHYHRYKEDVALMKEMGLKFYRFSVSWTRILPDGIGEINEKGVLFYNNLIDELIKNGIEPVITLFHWDYPLSLHRKGGWLNDESPLWFENYAKVCTELFSDRVKYFITINEPQVFLGTGYFEAKFAPFVKLPDGEIIKMGHNILLSHGRAVKAIRENAKGDVKIGFSPTGPCVEPKDEREKELEKARFLSFDFDEGNYVFSNSWWSDPIILGDYPAKAYELFGDILKDVIKKGDFEIISQPLDFYGVNIYETKPYSMKGDYLSNTYIGSPRNAMDWPICENALYYSAKFLYDRYKLPIIITENGMPCHDWVHLDGKVHDECRIDFVHRYLNGLKKAAEEGVDVMGYFYWSVMDNFEWSSGYDRRFGLIFVDYRTGERTVKESALWYKKVIESNGEIL